VFTIDCTTNGKARMTLVCSKSCQDKVVAHVEKPLAVADGLVGSEKIVLLPNYSDLPTDVEGDAGACIPLVVVPKPSAARINVMVTDFFSTLATNYDSENFRSTKRLKYTNAVDDVVASELRRSARPVLRALDLFCGTGRRALSIRELSGQSYRLDGFDKATDMVRLASERGLNMLPVNAFDFELEARGAPTDPLPGGPTNVYDAVTCLYSFGHLPDLVARTRVLKRLFRLLRPGGKLFMDVFNVLDSHNEWGPDIANAFRELHLEDEGYDMGDIFYKRTGPGHRSLSFLHYFSRMELVDLLKDCGFTIERFFTVGYGHEAGRVLEESDNGFDDAGPILLVARRNA